MYKTIASHVEVNGHYWEVNGQYSGIYLEMARKMIAQVLAMLSYHSKVLLIRFDLHVYEYTDRNELITKFNRILFKWLKSHYGLKRIGFIWCREIETAKKQHYHYVLMVDGHKVRHPIEILLKVKDVWDNHIQGFEYTPQDCYYNIRRDCLDSIQEAVYRVSYLAKGRGKKKKLAQTKSYGTSRLKPKEELE